MDPLLLHPTPDTPKIVLDLQNSIYEISGRSIPEDVALFYQPVLNWLDNIPEKAVQTINLEINLEYFNTASSKMILDILMRFEEMKKSKVDDVNVKWHFNNGDIDMKEAGEEYAELVSINFEFVSN